MRRNYDQFSKRRVIRPESVFTEKTAELFSPTDRQKAIFFSVEYAFCNEKHTTLSYKAGRLRESDRC
jgi:hypothetical protein